MPENTLGPPPLWNVGVSVKLPVRSVPVAITWPPWTALPVIVNEPPPAKVQAEGPSVRLFPVVKLMKQLLHLRATPAFAGVPAPAIVLMPIVCPAAPPPAPP